MGTSSMGTQPKMVCSAVCWSLMRERPTENIDLMLDLQGASILAGWWEWWSAKDKELNLLLRAFVSGASGRLDEIW